MISCHAAGYICAAVTIADWRKRQKCLIYAGSSIMGKIALKARKSLENAMFSRLWRRRRDLNYVRGIPICAIQTKQVQ